MRNLLFVVTVKGYKIFLDEETKKFTIFNGDDAFLFSSFKESKDFLKSL